MCLVVTTPDITAMTDAYAFLKVPTRAGPARGRCSWSTASRRAKATTTEPRPPSASSPCARNSSGPRHVSWEPCPTIAPSCAASRCGGRWWCLLPTARRRRPCVRSRAKCWPSWHPPAHGPRPHAGAAVRVTRQNRARNFRDQVRPARGPERRSTGGKQRTVVVCRARRLGGDGVAGRVLGATTAAGQ